MSSCSAFISKFMLIPKTNHVSKLIRHPPSNYSKVVFSLLYDGGTLTADFHQMNIHKDRFN